MMNALVSFELHLDEGLAADIDGGWMNDGWMAMIDEYSNKRFIFKCGDFEELWSTLILNSIIAIGNENLIFILYFIKIYHYQDIPLRPQHVFISHSQIAFSNPLIFSASPILGQHIQLGALWSKIRKIRKSAVKTIIIIPAVASAGNPVLSVNVKKSIIETRHIPYIYCRKYKNIKTCFKQTHKMYFYKHYLKANVIFFLEDNIKQQKFSSCRSTLRISYNTWHNELVLLFLLTL